MTIGPGGATVPIRRIMLLMPVTSYRATEFMAAARRLDADVIVASDHAQVLAAFVGDRSLRVELKPTDDNVATIVAHARRDSISAIIGTDDSTVELAARAAATLGLSHNPPAAVATARNKHSFRLAVAAAGVPSPSFRLTDRRDYLAAAAGVSYPCVLKPLALSASRGVIRADDAAEFLLATERIDALPRRVYGEDDSEAATKILVEDFIPGTEVALEGLLRHGRLQVLALFDKPAPLDGPFFEESIYVTPSRLPHWRQHEIVEQVTRAAAAVGLTMGPIHAEARVNADGVFVIEIAPRSIGGRCSRAVTLTHSVRLEEVILREALGLAVNPTPSGMASGVMMIPIPAAGRLRVVHGIDEAHAIPGIDELILSIPLGDELAPLPEGDRYLGFLLASGDTLAGVEAALRDAHRCLDIQIETADVCTDSPEVGDKRANALSMQFATARDCGTT
jgi:biotin carboxylase